MPPKHEGIWIFQQKLRIWTIMGNCGGKPLCLVVRNAKLATLSKVTEITSCGTAALERKK